MTRRPRKTIAAAILALAALTALYSLLWSDIVDGPSSSQYESSSTPRRLSAQLRLKDEMNSRVHRELVSRGHKPGTPRFERLLNKRVEQHIHDIVEGRKRKLQRVLEEKRRMEVVDTLKEKKEIWLRGGGRLPGRARHLTNAWHREGEVKDAASLHGEMEVRDFVLSLYFLQGVLQLGMEWLPDTTGLDALR